MNDFQKISRKFFNYSIQSFEPSSSHLWGKKVSSGIILRFRCKDGKINLIENRFFFVNGNYIGTICKRILIFSATIKSYFTLTHMNPKNDQNILYRLRFSWIYTKAVKP